jgi:hypothetical protein
MNWAAQLDWLRGTALSVSLREIDTLFALVESLHVLAITLVFGSITIVDLRLMGLASRERSVDQISAAVLPVTWVAFGFAVLTGVLLFISNPPGYFHNDFFFRKMVLILMAGINMTIFHVVLNPGINRDAKARRVPRSDLIVGALSMTLWVAVIACGRWIGFTMIGGG